jgi:hypothetical protein
MQVIQRIDNCAPVTYAAGELKYEATAVGTTSQRVFDSLTGETETNQKDRQAVNIVNTHASQTLYVFWVPRGASAPAANFTAAKCKKILAAGADCQLQFGQGISIYVLGSDADTTYTAEELA